VVTLLLNEVLPHFLQLPDARWGRLRLIRESQFHILGTYLNWGIHAPVAEDAAQSCGAAGGVCL
jgi:hypothetical protein